MNCKYTIRKESDLGRLLNLTEDLSFESKEEIKSYISNNYSQLKQLQDALQERFTV